MTTTCLVRTRTATAHDLAAVVDLHARCSPEALHRRFHAPLGALPPRLALQLICPVGGWSLLAERAGQVLAMACAGPLSTDDVEIGLLVEDASQGLGIGARLVRELAAEATRRGYRRVHCLTLPDNEAVLGTLRKAGLPFEAAHVDGLLQVLMPLAPGTAGLPLPA